MQNAAFRAWAKSMGYVVKKQPEALQGDGDVWGVPLNQRRGWLYDAGPNTVGVDFRGTTRLVFAKARELALLPGWRLQVVADDAVAGRMAYSAWDAQKEAVLNPRRRPRTAPR